MPQSLKLAVFRVATAARCELAIAAIMASNGDIGRPAKSRAATIRANARPASSSKGSTRPSPSRRGAGLLCSPYTDDIAAIKINQTVTGVAVRLLVEPVPGMVCGPSARLEDHRRDARKAAQT